MGTVDSRMTDRNLDAFDRDIKTIEEAQGGAASWEALPRILRLLVTRAYEERSPVVQRTRVAPSGLTVMDVSVSAPAERTDIDRAQQVCVNVVSRISNAEIRLFGLDDPDHPADVLVTSFVERVENEVERLRGARSASRDQIELATAVLCESLDMDTPEWSAMNVLLDACSKGSQSAPTGDLRRIRDRLEATAVMLESKSRTWADPNTPEWDDFEVRAQATREDIAALESVIEAAP